jgi:hypothetical protein
MQLLPSNSMGGELPCIEMYQALQLRPWYTPIVVPELLTLEAVFSLSSSSSLQTALTIGSTGANETLTYAVHNLYFYIL